MEGTHGLGLAPFLIRNLRVKRHAVLVDADGVPRLLRQAGLSVPEQTPRSTGRHLPEPAAQLARDRTFFPPVRITKPALCSVGKWKMRWMPIAALKNSDRTRRAARSAPRPPRNRRAQRSRRTASRISRKAARLPRVSTISYTGLHLVRLQICFGLIVRGVPTHTSWGGSGGGSKRV